jgi:hydrogenase nickel incorporation protein HypA/HybF
VHEMSLCQGILDIIQKRAAADRFSCVMKVRLSIGALSHVGSEAISFGFDVVTRNTIAEGADLEINQPPGQAFCMACSSTVTIPARGQPCPTCGSHQLMVVGGDELRVDELEVS